MAEKKDVTVNFYRSDEAKSTLYEAYQINLDDIDANTEVCDGDD